MRVRIRRFSELIAKVIYEWIADPAPSVSMGGVGATEEEVRGLPVVRSFVKNAGVYEILPLLCPTCQGETRVISFLRPPSGP